jgi:prevent-host-death family protein
MQYAKIATLKNNLSRYLAYVREGGEVLVLDRDTPVARLVPYAERDTAPEEPGAAEHRLQERLSEMERQGLIKRGSPDLVRGWLDAQPPVALPAGSGSVLDELLRMRYEDTR